MVESGGKKGKSELEKGGFGTIASAESRLPF